MSEWQPQYSEEERRQRHYERYGTTEVPERQYRRRTVGQAESPVQTCWPFILVSAGAGLFIGYVVARAFGEPR